MVTICSSILTESGPVTLSANACANGARLPLPASRPFRSHGDFAETAQGRARRMARRRKMAWQNACLEG